MEEGAGARVRRLMPVAGLMNFDPFVLWDHFNVGEGTGFPDHPHRGFEAITYLFEGGMVHDDNLGNHSVVTRGGAQRFTAGSGIVHSEMPADGGGAVGIQLWVNLPRSLKGVDPDYQPVVAEAIPETSIAGGVVRTIVGSGSPLQLLSRVHYLDVTLERGASYHHTLPDGFRGLIYPLAGEVSSGGESVSAVLAEALLVDGVAELVVDAKCDCHFMFCFGRPHNEPIRQHGPYVD